MRQPRAAFAGIDAETFQTVLDVVGEHSRSPSAVLEDEHADAPRLAVAAPREPDLPPPSRSFAQRVDHRLELPGRPVTEERERDVQVLSANRTDILQLLALPVLDRVEHVVGQAERKEEPEPFIAAHASGRSHAASSRLPVRSARRRWSAVTVARTRTCPRSPGRSSMRASDPSGPAACRWTSPTGFSGVPPSGPATPVTATATSAPSRARAPAAIAAAVSADTAPNDASVASGTPSEAAFTSFAYATTAPANTSLAPATSVSRAATMPPVH